MTIQEEQNATTGFGGIPARIEQTYDVGNARVCWVLRCHLVPAVNGMMLSSRSMGDARKQLSECNDLRQVNGFKPFAVR